MWASFAAQDKLRSDQIKLQLEDAATKDKLIDLNRSSLEELTQITEGEATSDLWPILRKVAREYKEKIENIIKIPSNIVDDFSKDNPQKESFLSTLSDLMKKGKVLHELATRAVVQISPEIVVKISSAGDLTDVHNLHHVRQASGIPAPEPLGVFSIGRRAYTFMTFMPGITLERIWTELTLEQKDRIRVQLNHIFAKLRALPVPSQHRHLGGGIPVRCQDTRRHSRTSDTPIENVAQFHDFLLSGSRCAPSWVDLIRSSLRDDCQVVMTHGDLHPRNIIVSDAQNVNITGIIDWEFGGGYPAYWEYVTSLRRSWTSDEDDWPLFLPERATGKYVDEKIKDCQIDRVVD